LCVYYKQYISSFAIASFSVATFKTVRLYLLAGGNSLSSLVGWSHRFFYLCIIIYLLFDHASNYNSGYIQEFYILLYSCHSCHRIIIILVFFCIFSAFFYFAVSFFFFLKVFDNIYDVVKTYTVTSLVCINLVSFKI